MPRYRGTQGSKRKAYNEALRDARYKTEQARRIRAELIAAHDIGSGPSMRDLEAATLKLQSARTFKTGCE